MDALSPVWQSPSLGALPLIMTDTSALVDLASLELVQDKENLRSPEARANIVRATIDNLLAGNSRTMVMTRRNFIELFQTISGSLDLTQEDDGTLRIPDGPLPGEFRFPDSQIIYNILQDYQANGRLRCYSNSNDFLMEEVGKPQVGIVIVDVQARGEYPKHGRLANHASMLGQVLDANSAETKAAQQPDAADDRLIGLAEKIHDYSNNMGYSQKFLVLNNDKGLSDRFKALADRMVGTELQYNPIHSRALDVVAALYKGAQDTIAGCDITGAELAAMARATIIDREKRGKYAPSPASVERRAGLIADWLDVTASDRTQESWVSRCQSGEGRALG